MKKKLKQLCVVMLAVMLSMGMSVPTMAASSKYNAAVKSYRGYLRHNTGNYWIADIDGNGYPELIMHNTKTYANEVHTYNPKTKKRKRLIKLGYGKAYNYPIKYSRSKHNVLMMQADTGGYHIYVWKIKGTKASKILTSEYINGKFARFGSQYRAGYKINGKRVSGKTNNKKVSSLMKKARSLQPTTGY